jgi:hypothetical protein
MSLHTIELLIKRSGSLSKTWTVTHPFISILEYSNPMSSIVCDASTHYEFQFDRSRHRRQHESLMENQKKPKEGYVDTSFNNAFFAEPENRSVGAP